MSDSIISGFSRNIHKSYAVYNMCFQRMVEKAFSELSVKYQLKEPLYYSHNYVLQVIYYQEKPLTLAEISKRSGQALPNVSTAAASLRENELIICQRLEKDKRKYAVVLSEKGKNLCDEYLQHYLPEICSILWEGVPQADFETTFRTMERAEANARNYLMKSDYSD